MSILLSALVEVLGYGAEVLDNGNGLDLSIGRVEDSLTVAMELTHGTKGLCVTWV